MLKISLYNSITFPDLISQIKVVDFQAVHYSVQNNEVYILSKGKLKEYYVLILKPKENSENFSNSSHTIDNIDISIISLGNLDYDIQKLYPIKNNFLLLIKEEDKDIRDNFTDPNKPENINALIVNREQKIIKELNLGSEISNCIIDKDNTIIISHSHKGGGKIIRWSENGEKLWENNIYNIYDCITSNIDQNNNLWFYYSKDYHLVRTNYTTNQSFNPNISNISQLLFRKNGESILFEIKKNNYHERFCIRIIQDETLGGDKEAVFTYNDRKIFPSGCIFHLSQILLWNKARLYWGTWK